MVLKSVIETNLSQTTNLNLLRVTSLLLLSTHFNTYMNISKDKITALQRTISQSVTITFPPMKLKHTQYAKNTNVVIIKKYASNINDVSWGIFRNPYDNNIVPVDPRPEACLKTPNVDACAEKLNNKFGKFST